MIEFTQGLFTYCNNIPQFNQHLRDFLVNMNEFADEDNSELFREELELEEKLKNASLAAVPGIIKPIDLITQNNNNRNQF